MAHFVGSVFGRSGTEMRRTGDKQSGVSTHVKTSTSGVYVSAFEVSSGQTEYRIWSTSGDDGTGRRTLIATLTHDADGTLDEGTVDTILEEKYIEYTHSDDYDENLFRR